MLCSEGTPGKLDRDGTLVDDLVVLVREEGDRGGVSSYVTLGEVDIVVVGFTECGDSALKVIEAER